MEKKGKLVLEVEDMKIKDAWELASKIKKGIDE